VLRWASPSGQKTSAVLHLFNQERRSSVLEKTRPVLRGVFSHPRRVPAGQEPSAELRQVRFESPFFSLNLIKKGRSSVQFCTGLPAFSTQVPDLAT
jgi:hypothetical protein